jgi:single-strand selective monofunctional uracil DNA glycosylase
MNVADLAGIHTDTLNKSLECLRFGAPVTHVYNPHRYARRPWTQYIERYARPGVQAIFIGMNPGPWGMAQTGIPFGEIAAVRDWLVLDGPLHRPENEHPKRLVQGLDCARSEVSGRRVWGWAAENFASPDAFFEQFFIANYCPLSFMEESGRNRTPNKLPAEERTPLYAACDAFLRRLVDTLRPQMVIGIGAFAEERAREALGEQDVAFGRILHPSPASPAANRGWAPQATAQLRALGFTIGGK